MADVPHLSFVVAAHNEEDSLPVLCEEIRAAARAIGKGYEILVVDDGSTDGTGPWLEAQGAAADDLVVIRLPKNRGQSAALAIGLEHARGEILVTLDADLQNDPKDTALLLEALPGHDLACGVRQGRKDTFAKRYGSRLANGFRRWALNDRFQDVGCTLKAWRRPVARRMPKFKGFHRFIPILAEAEGFRVVEVPVSHRARQHGQTHYGQLSRAVAGLRDVLGVAWLKSRHIDLSTPEEPGT